MAVVIYGWCIWQDATEETTWWGAGGGGSAEGDDMRQQEQQLRSGENGQQQWASRGLGSFYMYVLHMLVNASMVSSSACTHSTRLHSHTSTACLVSLINCAFAPRGGA